LIWREIIGPSAGTGPFPNAIALGEKKFQKLYAIIAALPANLISYIIIIALKIPHTFFACFLTTNTASS
jgi:hypothetical protein